MAIKITRKGTIILSIIGVVLLLCGIGFTAWYINQADDVTPTDSSAAYCDAWDDDRDGCPDHCASDGRRCYWEGGGEGCEKGSIDRDFCGGEDDDDGCDPPAGYVAEVTEAACINGCPFGYDWIADNDCGVGKGYCDCFIQGSDGDDSGSTTTDFCSTDQHTITSGLIPDHEIDEICTEDGYLCTVYTAEYGFDYTDEGFTSCAAACPGYVPCSSCSGSDNSCYDNCYWSNGTQCLLPADEGENLLYDCSDEPVPWCLPGGGSDDCPNGVVDPGEECDPDAPNTCSYGDCRSNCTCPSVTVETNPPQCDGLTVTGATGTGGAALPDDTLTITGRGSDPDGTPSRIWICTTPNGLTTAQYQQIDGAYYNCYQQNTPGASYTVTRTSTQMAQDLLNRSAISALGLSVDDILSNGIQVFVHVFDDSNDQYLCVGNPIHKPSATTGVLLLMGGDYGDSCLSDCLVDQAFQVCGDGTIDPGEECDPVGEVSSACEFGDRKCMVGCVCPIEPPETCPNGVLDDGEDCDYEATPGTPDNNCTYGDCNDSCQCPLPAPMINVIKSASWACVEGADVYSRVEYTVEVRNRGLTVGTIERIVDTLDNKVQEGWIESSSPVGDINGNIITWTLTGEDQIIEVDEVMTFTYVVHVPMAQFGEYTNTAEVYIIDEGFDNVEVTFDIDVDCEGTSTTPGTTPGTGLFDSTLSRIILGFGIIVLSFIYMKTNWFDRITVKFAQNVTEESQVENSRDKFEQKLEKNKEE